MQEAAAFPAPQTPACAPAWPVTTSARGRGIRGQTPSARRPPSSLAPCVTLSFHPLTLFSHLSNSLRHTPFHHNSLTPSPCLNIPQHSPDTSSHPPHTSFHSPPLSSHSCRFSNPGNDPLPPGSLSQPLHSSWVGAALQYDRGWIRTYSRHRSIWKGFLEEATSYVFRLNPRGFQKERSSCGHSTWKV